MKVLDWTTILYLAFLLLIVKVCVDELLKHRYYIILLLYIPLLQPIADPLFVWKKL